MFNKFSCEVPGSILDADHIDAIGVLCYINSMSWIIQYSCTQNFTADIAYSVGGITAFSFIVNVQK